VYCFQFLGDMLELCCNTDGDGSVTLFCIAHRITGNATSQAAAGLWIRPYVPYSWQTKHCISGQ